MLGSTRKALIMTTFAFPHFSRVGIRSFALVALKVKERLEQNDTGVKYVFFYSLHNIFTVGGIFFKN